MDVILKLILNSPVVNSLNCGLARKLNTKAGDINDYVKKSYVDYLALQLNRDGVFTFCNAMFKSVMFCFIFARNKSW